MIIGNLQFTIAARGLAVLPAVPPALLSKVFRRIVVHNIYLFWFCGCKGKKLMRNVKCVMRNFFKKVSDFSFYRGEG